MKYGEFELKKAIFDKKQDAAQGAAGCRRVPRFFTQVKCK